MVTYNLIFTQKARCFGDVTVASAMVDRTFTAQRSSNTEG